MVSCGSVAGSFYYAEELDIYEGYSDDCGTGTMAPPPLGYNGPTFLSTSKKEAEEYWWVEYSDNDYYQYRLEDDSYLEDDLKTSLGFISCSEFLREQVEGFSNYLDADYEALGSLYLQLADNADQAAPIFQAMHDLPNTKASRAQYMELENDARTLEVARRDIFLEVRKLIDVTYVDNVQVFIERCPIYFNVFGDITQEIGVVYLKNYGESAQDVNLTIGFTDDEGIIVGQDYIISRIPGKATVKATISGSSSLQFPAHCFVQVNEN